MHCSFEELGVTPGKVSFGHFTGEAQFNDAGAVDQIDLARDSFEELNLDVEKLFQVRTLLRRKYGSAYLEHWSNEVTTYHRKSVVFEALAETIERVYAEDIRDYLAEIKGVTKGQGPQ
jgi:hypothetical protein